MYKEMHGVFEVIEDAIDAAYEAQRILEANYTTEVHRRCQGRSIEGGQRRNHQGI